VALASACAQATEHALTSATILVHAIVHEHASIHPSLSMSPTSFSKDCALIFFKFLRVKNRAYQTKHANKAIISIF